MLQNFGTALSREQMKNVNGGREDGGTVCACNASYNCICGSTSTCSEHPSKSNCIVCSGVDSCV